MIIKQFRITVALTALAAMASVAVSAGQVVFRKAESKPYTTKACHTYTKPNRMPGTSSKDFEADGGSCSNDHHPVSHCACDSGARGYVVLDGIVCAGR
jgi:hypothetical protein